MWCCSIKQGVTWASEGFQCNSWERKDFSWSSSVRPFNGLTFYFFLWSMTNLIIGRLAESSMPPDSVWGSQQADEEQTIAGRNLEQGQMTAGRSLEQGETIAGRNLEQGLTIVWRGPFTSGGRSPEESPERKKEQSKGIKTLKRAEGLNVGPRRTEIGLCSISRKVTIVGFCEGSGTRLRRGSSRDSIETPHWKWGGWLYNPHSNQRSDLAA